MKNTTAILLLTACLGFTACEHETPTDVKTETPSQEGIPVLLVATYHFVNQGLDTYNNEVDDYLTEQRQLEMKELAEALDTFKPTKILIEQNPKAQSYHDSLYIRYLNNELELNSIENAQNEVYQLGYRLGKMNEVEQMHCVDADGWFLGSAVDMVADSMKLNTYLDFKASSALRSRENNEFILNHTLLENFKRENDQDQILANHSSFNNHMIQVRDPENILASKYVEELREIDGEQYVMRGLDGENIGVECYIEWFKRNVRIYSNILDVT